NLDAYRSVELTIMMVSWHESSAGTALSQDTDRDSQ
ncbi:MAG: hypothetical protein ACI9HK_006084, partial [Pirellulaceae bacterium]